MALQRAGVQLTAEGASSFLGEMDRANRAVTEFGQTTDRAGSQVNASSQVMIGALRQVGALAVNAFVEAGRAAAGFIGDSISAAADYESTLNRFNAVTGSAIGDAGLTLDQFSQKFLELGAQTQFSAGQAAEAAVELAKGGVPITAIMNDAADATLGLAAAGELELATSAGIVAKQLGVWGEQGVTAANVADLLAQAANASTVDVDELAMGLAQAGGVAKVAGVSFQDTVQTMALLAPGFGSASDAGTSFKTFLQRLQPTTKPAIAAMRDLGLFTDEAGSAFYDQQGQFVGMQTASELLAQATSGLSEAERLMAFQTIFGADAIRAASMIAGAGAEGFDAMGASMAGAGTAAEQAALRNQGFNFAMESLRGSLETVQIVLGTALLPVLTDFVNNALIPGVNAALQFAQGILSANDPIAALTTQLTTLVPGFGTFLGAVQTALPYVMQFGQFLADNWQPVLAAIGALILSVVVPAMAAAVVSFVAVMAPIAAIAAAGTALYLAWQTNFGGIRDITQTVFETVQSVIQTVLGFVSGFVAEHGAEIEATLTGAWETIQSAISTISEAVQSIVTTIFGAVQSFLAEHGDEIQSTLTLAWETIQTVIDGAVAVIEGVIVPIFTGIATFLSDHKTEIVTVLETAWSLIQNAIETTLNVIQGIVKTVMALIKGDWDTAWEEIKGIAETIIEGVKDSIDIGINAARDIVASLGPKISELAGDFLAKATALGQSLIDGILAGLSGLADKARETIIGGISGGIEGVKSFFGIGSPSKYTRDEIGEPLAEGILVGFVQESARSFNRMARTVERLALDVADVFKRPAVLRGWTVAGQAAVDAYIDSIQGRGIRYPVTVPDAVAQLAADAATVLKGEPVLRGWTEAGQSAIDTYIDSIKAEQSGVGDALTETAALAGQTAANALADSMLAQFKQRLQDAIDAVADPGSGDGNGLPPYRPLDPPSGPRPGDPRGPTTPAVRAAAAFITPPATPSQQATAAAYNNVSYGPTLNYQPTYVQPARVPQQDAALMLSLVGR